jgi:hypothetical protein
MVIRERNERGKAEDVSVICQQKEGTRRKNNKRGSQSTKMNKSKKRAQQRGHFNACPWMKG